MSDYQEFERLIAGLPAKADRLFKHWSPERKREWVEHVTERANYYRNHLTDGLQKALVYLSA